MVFATRSVTGLLAIIALVITALSSPAAASKCPHSFPTCQGFEGSFDSSKFLGTWYNTEVSNSFIFGRDCYCTTATYGSIDNGTKISVENKCHERSITGKISDNVGSATIPDAKNPCKLAVVQPPNPFPGPLDIIKTDYTSYAVIATCTWLADVVWFLSRTPTMNATLSAALKTELSGLGFDLSDLRDVTQDGCNYNATRSSMVFGAKLRGSRVTTEVRK